MGFFASLWKKKENEPPAGPVVPAVKVIKVSNYLSEKTICFFNPGASKQEVLARLIDSMDLPDAQGALKAILERETAGTTVIAPGIAVPHARLSGLSQLVASIGICSTGVPEPSAEDAPTRLFVLFVGPAANMKEHLGFLASIASLFQTDGFGDSLLLQTTPKDVLQKIRSTEQSL